MRSTISGPDMSVPVPRRERQALLSAFSEVDFHPDVPRKSIGEDGTIVEDADQMSEEDLHHQQVVASSLARSECVCGIGCNHCSVVVWAVWWNFSDSASTQVHNVDQLWLVLYHQLRVLSVDPRIEVSPPHRSIVACTS